MHRTLGLIKIVNQLMMLVCTLYITNAAMQKKTGNSKNVHRHSNMYMVAVCCVTCCVQTRSSACPRSHTGLKPVYVATGTWMLAFEIRFISNVHQHVPHSTSQLCGKYTLCAYQLYAPLPPTRGNEGNFTVFAFKTCPVGREFELVNAHAQTFTATCLP